MSREYVIATRSGILAFALTCTLGAGVGVGTSTALAQSTPVPDHGNACTSILAGTPIAGHSGDMHEPLEDHFGIHAGATPQMDMGMDSHASTPAGGVGMSPQAGTPEAGLAGNDGQFDPQMADFSFLTMMEQHHMGAIEMARIALPRLERPELRDLADRIIASQEAEIAEMQELRSSMEQGTPTARTGDLAEMMNMMMQSMPGAMQGTDMAGMGGQMPGAYLERLCSSETPDLEFINQMIPHHAGAIAMAEAVIAHGGSSEVRALAEQIIQEQTAEIEQMRSWRDAWSDTATPTS